MSIQSAVMFFVTCDSCKAEPEYYDDAARILFETAELAEADVSLHAEYADDWTTDGEGKHHCEKCPRLVVTAAGLAIRARELTESDVPLFEVAP
ncbi:MAG: hypothetical protein JWP85_2095 [Rhodoglobus sp.]|nr:hypothetical protein [Rhodoglobus sp.]